MTTLHSRLLPRRWLPRSSVPLWRQVLLQTLLGAGVLGVGLAVFGHDGKMVTYGALVLVAASVQWLLSRPWRS